MSRFSLKQDDHIFCTQSKNNGPFAFRFPPAFLLLSFCVAVCRCSVVPPLLILFLSFSLSLSPAPNHYALSQSFYLTVLRRRKLLSLFSSLHFSSSLLFFSFSFFLLLLLLLFLFSSPPNPNPNISFSLLSVLVHITYC